MEKNLPSRKKKGGRRSVFIAILLSAALAVAVISSELILRAFDSPNPGDLPTFYIDHPTYYSYRPGFQFEWPNEDGISISISTDENGFRNPAGYLSQCEAILLGDSFVAGLNTREDRTLAGLLREKGLEVYNAGVDMYSNGQALQVLKALTAKINPKKVVLAVYQGNDFRDNYFARPPNPAAFGSSSESTRAGPKDKLKLVYFSMAANCLLLRTLHTHLYLGILKGRASDPMASFTLSEMTTYRNQYGATMIEAVAKTDSILGEFAAEAKQKGFRLLVLGIPSKAAVLRSFKEIALYDKDNRSRDFALETIRQGYSFEKPDSLLGALTRRHGLPYLSLMTLFRDNLDAAPYYHLDIHWRDNGQKLAADTLWEALRQLQ